jgi:hypothetical protein
VELLPPHTPHASIVRLAFTVNDTTLLIIVFAPPKVSEMYLKCCVSRAGLQLRRARVCVWGGAYADAAICVGDEDEIRDQSDEEENADAVVIPDVLKRGRGRRWT